MNTIQSLKWRYATKKFNSDKEVSLEHLELILSAGNLTATSYGLQPISFVVVSSDELKEKLLTHAYNQNQITTCSHLIVLCASTKINEHMVDHYMHRIADERDMKVEDLKNFRDAIVSDVANRTQEEKTTWAEKQAYIALGSMMIAAAELEIDGCPMEGFDKEKFNEVLGLSEKELTSAVLFPIGYRSEEDETQNYEKVRKEINEIVIRK